MPTFDLPDPVPDPYPEIDQEMYPLYLAGGTYPADVGDEERSAYTDWLTSYASVFEKTPSSFGLRGDDLLWEDLKERLGPLKMPDRPDAFVKSIQSTFHELVGVRWNTRSESVAVPKYESSSGMSAGLVCPDWWRAAGLAQLISRYKTSLRLASVALCVSEKAFDILLEHAFRTDACFVSWMLDHTRCAGEAFTYSWSRSDNPWTTVNHVRSDGSMFKRDGETDVLIVLEGSDERRIALHIEDKLPGRGFELHQAESYALRAEKWRGQKRYGRYTEWTSILIAPHATIKTMTADVAHFQVAIPFEDVAARIGVPVS